MTPNYALLQAATAARPGAGLMLGLQIVAILAIFYFMMIRPQQKQRKQHESTLMGLKKGDEIVTVGGIIGRVVHIRETPTEGGNSASTLADQVTIQSAESRLIVERGRIARIGTV